MQKSEKDSNLIKCVVVGDGTVGKTCLLITYCTNKFPEEYIPTIFDNYTVDISIDKKKYTVALFDTAGQEGYDRLRPMAYDGADVFLVCFSVNLPSSLHNVQYQWVKEIQKYCPQAPFILVGTKTDLRKSPKEIEKFSQQKERHITYEEGLNVSKKIGALQYIECSALKQTGLKAVFDQAIGTALGLQEKSKKQSCLIL